MNIYSESSRREDSEDNDFFSAGMNRLKVIQLFSYRKTYPLRKSFITFKCFIPLKNIIF